MTIELMKSKIHRATVTESDLNYVGSITIDENLIRAVDLVENERVHIYNINNGHRFDTYVIKGKKGSGEICLNGASARHVQLGDKVIIVSYCRLDRGEAENHIPKVITVDDDNKIKDVISG